ncbi:MAG: hypothetical protein ACKVIV_04210 [Flavobacteriales bacterium]|jgi:hypothetical protein|tara:strand:+ start:9170 stop:9619 length:450 start_codon:yes stop_codon:yes gene_type:complete
MKNIIIVLIVFFTISSVFSQQERMSREKIDAYKKLYLTDKLNLERSSELAFWTSYKSYQDSLSILYRENRLKYREMNIDDMNASDEEYAEYITDFMNYEKKKVDLKGKLISELKEVMSIRKTYMLFRYEDDFRREMMEMLRKSREQKKE